jgi:hypothetical protein
LGRPPFSTEGGEAPMSAVRFRLIPGLSVGRATLA